MDAVTQGGFNLLDASDSQICATDPHIFMYEDQNYTIENENERKCKILLGKCLVSIMFTMFRFFALLTIVLYY